MPRVRMVRSRGEPMLPSSGRVPAESGQNPAVEIRSILSHARRKAFSNNGLTRSKNF